MATNIFKIRSTPPPGKKLVRDWEGMTIRTLREMSNGWGTFKKGTIAVVTYARGGTGLHLKSEPCNCCGVSMSISKVSVSDVEIVTPNVEVRGPLHRRVGRQFWKGKL